MPPSGVSSSSMGEKEGGIKKERDEKREVLDSFRTDSSFNEDENDYDILNTLSPEVHYDKSPKKQSDKRGSETLEQMNFHKSKTSNQRDSFILDLPAKKEVRDQGQHPAQVKFDITINHQPIFTLSSEQHQQQRMGAQEGASHQSPPDLNPQSRDSSKD